MADEQDPARSSRFGGLRGRLSFGRRDPERDDPQAEGVPTDPHDPEAPRESEADDAPLLRPATARDPIEPSQPETPPYAESPAAPPVPPTPAPATPRLANPALTPGIPRDTPSEAVEQPGAPGDIEAPPAVQPERPVIAASSTTITPPSTGVAGPAVPTPPVLPPPVPEHASMATAMPPPIPLDPEPGYPQRGALERVLEPETPSLRRPTPRMTPHLAVLTGMATLVMLAFLLIEPSPRWLLLLGAAAVIFGLDGTLKQTWRLPFAAGAETAPYLFVPALYMLAVPVLIEHNIRGELVLPIALLAGAGFGAIAWAETASVRPLSPEHPIGRLVATGGAYIAGFALFSLTYVFDVSLPSAALAVALVSAMLAVEILREGEVDPMETLGFALVTGAVMAEARWLLYYMPLDTYLAGLTLLLAFYLVTGLLHSHVTRALTLPLSLEYSAIAAAGLALVVVARAAGLA